MSNIFNLSLHRSGTQSAHDLFRRAGISTVHWVANVGGIDYQAMAAGRETDLNFVADSLAPVFREYREVSDAPIPALYRQLATRIPDARFFALHRSSESWIASVRRHIGTRPFVPYEKVMYWAYFMEKPESIIDISDKELKSFHIWHYDSLDTFFSNSRNFLTLKLDSPGIGSEISKFCQIPSIPFRRFDYALGHNTFLNPDDVNARVTE